MKTVRLDEETHEMLLKKINEMERKYNIRFTIESLVNSILIKGIREYDIIDR